jgi:transcriptional regulator with XRE-family HTH domain
LVRPGDTSLRHLLAQLRAARVRAGFSQEQLAYRLRTTKSAVSRLERGLHHRPTLTTIENYALVVGCRVEITLKPWP